MSRWFKPFNIKGPLFNGCYDRNNHTESHYREILVEAHKEEDARLQAPKLPDFAALAVEAVGLKATISSLAESCEKESKVDPSQLPDFTSVVPDVAKI